jgi:hypothetical protein
MHLADLMGMEVRGMPLTALFLPDARAAASEALDRAFDGPAKVTLVLTGERGIGRGPLDACLMLLPLLDDEGRVTRLLGALEAKGAIGRQPRRFTIVETRFAAASVVARRPEAPTPAPQPQAAGFAEPAASFTPRRPHPHLRLVRDDE